MMRQLWRNILHWNVSATYSPRAGHTNYFTFPYLSPFVPGARGLSPLQDRSLRTFHSEGILWQKTQCPLSDPGAQGCGKRYTARDSLEEDYTADSRTILETVSLDFNNEREVTHQLLRTYNQKSNTYIKLSCNGAIEVSSLNRKCLLTPPVANENIETQVFW